MSNNNKELTESGGYWFYRIGLDVSWQYVQGGPPAILMFTKRPLLVCLSREKRLFVLNFMKAVVKPAFP